MNILAHASILRSKLRGIQPGAIQVELRLGYSLEDSIVLSSLKRVRPIMLTTLTTVIGLLPLSLQGGEMWRPMANTIIFGLSVSSIVGVILCPVLYTVLFKGSFQNYSWNERVIREKTTND
ncbi:MAG: efflux RND transporter permease subunit [Candidatus Caenarcaniphilales bacterium]|nr:efflux RND transporter permease subunit [Candidatus Caenarcaniphilales bacterium]